MSIFYDTEDKIKLEFPLSIEEAQKLYDRGKIIEVFFFKEEEKWFASYEFFN